MGKDSFDNRPELSFLIQARFHICCSVNPGVQFEACNLLRPSPFLKVRWSYAKHIKVAGGRCNLPAVSLRFGSLLLIFICVEVLRL